jgi:hypothetical protein
MNHAYGLKESFEDYLFCGEKQSQFFFLISTNSITDNITSSKYLLPIITELIENYMYCITNDSTKISKII